MNNYFTVHDRPSIASLSMSVHIRIQINIIVRGHKTYRKVSLCDLKPRNKIYFLLPVSFRYCGYKRRLKSIIMSYLANSFTIDYPTQNIRHNTWILMIRYFRLFNFSFKLHGYVKQTTFLFKYRIGHASREKKIR